MWKNVAYKVSANHNRLPTKATQLPKEPTLVLHCDWLTVSNASKQYFRYFWGIAEIVCSLNVSMCFVRTLSTASRSTDDYVMMWWCDEFLSYREMRWDYYIFSISFVVVFFSFRGNFNFHSKTASTQKNSSILDWNCFIEIWNWTHSIFGMKIEYMHN